MIEVPERVLCLVAHPDDLEPQAGGTIIRLTDAGSVVRIINAITPYIDKWGREIEGAKAQREEEARLAANVLGVDDAYCGFYRYQPDDFAHTQSVVQRYDDLVRQYAPDLIISHHEVDTQQDHVVMAKIAETVCRRNRIALWQLSHSFPGGYLPHRPAPNLFVDTTAVHERKMSAVWKYTSQRERYDGLFSDGWLGTIEARDRYYGGMLNQDGMHDTVYAEGFVVGKMVWK